MPKKKTSAKQYYKRKFYRRFKYTYGSANYMRMRHEVTLTMGFPSSAGQIEFKGSPATSGISLGALLLKSAAYVQYGDMFNERKIKGVRVECMPSNTVTVGTSNPCLIGYAPFNNATYQNLTGSNSSSLVDLNNKIVKYTPLRFGYKPINHSDFDEGGVFCASMGNSSSSDYPRYYIVKIIIYVLYKGIRI